MAPELAEEVGEIVDRRKSWFRLFIIWQIIAWILIVWIAIGSAIVASKFDADEIGVKAIALTVAGASAMLAVLHPQQRARAYRRAWVALDAAIKTEVGVYPPWLQALAIGEAYIGEEPDTGGSN